MTDTEPRSSAPKNEAITLCTFPIADAETFDTHDCGRIARAWYTTPLGRLPRCSRHDTAIVKDEALRRGYDREDIE